MNAAGPGGAAMPRPARERHGVRAVIHPHAGDFIESGGQAASVCLDMGRSLVRRGR